MGSKERREREKQATRDSILTATRQIAESEGWSAVTIRRIADSIDYTAPIVYQHFKNKEDALNAVVQEEFERLIHMMESARVSEKNPEAALLKLGEAYLEHALNNLRMYELMNGMAGVDLEATFRCDGCARVCEVAEEALGRWAESRQIQFPSIKDIAETLWALFHGAICIVLVNPCDVALEKARRLSMQTLQDLMLSWEVRYRMA